MTLAQKVFLHAISVPALNKWTTVAPCVNLVSAMQHFCDVLPQAFGLCFPKGPQAESTESEDEGRDVGAPLDQTKMWRKLAMKRQIKASTFMQDEDSKWLTLLWAAVTSPIMLFHYKLFKQGTWVTERKKNEQQDEPDNAVVFSNHALNPATKALSFLTDMVLDTVQVAAWGPLVGMYGTVLQVACNPENPFHCNGTVMEKVVGALGKVSLPGCLRICLCYLWKINKGKPSFFLLSRTVAWIVLVPS